MSTLYAVIDGCYKTVVLADDPKQAALIAIDRWRTRCATFSAAAVARALEVKTLEVYDGDASWLFHALDLIKETTT